jgi:hypothetical protein
MEEEYCMVRNIRFPSIQYISLHDASWNGIEMPQCEKCGNFKSLLTGKEAFTWICWECG